MPSLSVIKSVQFFLQISVGNFRFPHSYSTGPGRIETKLQLSAVMHALLAPPTYVVTFDRYKPNVLHSIILD